MEKDGSKLSLAEMFEKCYAIEKKKADFDCCEHENDFHHDYNGDDDADCYCSD